MPSVRVLAVGAAAFLALLGCGACGPPCGQDPLGCENGEDFRYAPECGLEGPLEVTLGQGVMDFELLEAGQEPIVHEGSQGGEHLCLGLRVDNPVLEFPQMRVSYTVEVNDADRCDGSDPECDPWVGTGKREFVLGPDLPLDDEERLEDTGFIVLLSLWPEELERRILLDVEDPCRRTGSVDHRVPAEP